MPTQYDCLALFSGGLDSLLACKLIQEQNLRVLGIHFISPFFGRPHRVREWQEMHGIDILPLDISGEYIDLLLKGPCFGFGKCLNPCVDCKIFMLRRTRELLSHFGAEFIITGEVLGQRPMSQRRDALQIILREAGVRDILLRPLSAANLEVTAPERSGLVDREGLLGIKGRGRKEQLQLAESFGLREIPTPAGGCLLTDPESVKRFATLFRHKNRPGSEDFELAKVGRQYWSGSKWLVIGRNRSDNERLAQLVQEGDILFKLTEVPGPMALGRPLREPWGEEDVAAAARFMLRFSPKAMRSERPVTVRAAAGDCIREVSVDPGGPPEPGWSELSWEDFQQAKDEIWARANEACTRKQG